MSVLAFISAIFVLWQCLRNRRRRHQTAEAALSPYLIISDTRQAYNPPGECTLPYQSEKSNHDAIFSQSHTNSDRLNSRVPYARETISQPNTASGASVDEIAALRAQVERLEAQSHAQVARLAVIEQDQLPPAY